jgi:hypothetical protein
MNLFLHILPKVFTNYFIAKLSLHISGLLLKNSRCLRTGSVAQMVEYLPRKAKALNSNLIPLKKKKKWSLFSCNW